MLEFLKKIFKNEEQEIKPAREIKLQDLKEWIEEKSKPLMEEVNRRTEEILMKVNEELERTRFNVEILENAKLQNPNIPFKAKQYMEGNRKAYAKSIISFLGHMEINNKDYFYLVEFCKEFDELLDDINKGTLRSYTILQEFFANEAGKIAQNLRNFNTLFKELKSELNNEKMVTANNVKGKAESLITKSKQKINLDVDFKSAEAEFRLANSEKDSIMSEISNFSLSEEHNNFIKLNEERKNIEKNFYEDENQILQSFSVLERPLRKYSHIAFEHEEIVLDYLKNSIETLVDDKELKILDVLKNLEKMLNEGQIQLDEKKKEKSYEEIKKMSKEFIDVFLKGYFSFKSEMEELEHRIKSTRVTEKLRNLNKNLEEINIRIEKNSAEYERLKADVEKLSNAIPTHLFNIKKDLEKNFHAVLISAFNKLDLVTREEFDAQTKVLARTRQKVEALETEIKALEKMISKKKT